jgi:hypothetical protein
MLEERLLKILIRKTLKEKLKLRTRKGYGVSHPIINHKPFMKGLGKSDYEEEPDQKKQEDQSPVKVSKAFESDPLDDLREYQQIIEELLNAT